MSIKSMAAAIGRLMTVEQLAKNHFMKPEELEKFALANAKAFTITTDENGKAIVHWLVGGMLLAAAKDSGLKRHPELYGLKENADGTAYISV